MQILNHSLTLSFYTHREYETVRGAVRIYLHWLQALTDIPDGNIPRPLLDTPEKYFRNIIDALRNLFCRRSDVKGEVPRGLAIERQAREVETVLDAISTLTHSASHKYQNEVTVVESWARKLLALTVLVCRYMYGEDYCKILIHDESITPFACLPPGEEDDDLLYHSWRNFFSLMDSPADILAHDPAQNKPISVISFRSWIRRQIS
ncbi:unnamed protein product [Strongylus vulgaris]|uniref:Uncharacterized protein n=1 Tax=Strongylus vulgaris TaxID=40348 RepID=A0A3P7LC20_STRVU|nr:unnamed protein product [Strongylus vulgaris]